MYHHLQHFKSKAYHKASNDQLSINIHQEKLDTLEEVMEAEHEDRRQNMHCLEEDLYNTGKNLTDIVAYMRCDACRQIDEIE